MEIQDKFQLIHDVLPIELLEYIFSMIDVYSLFAKLVCKQWHCLIDLNDNYLNTQAKLLVAYEDVHCLKYIITNGYPLPIHHEFCNKFSYLLGKNGSVEEINFVTNYGYNLDNSCVACGAAKYSHLNILEYLKKMNDRLFLSSNTKLFGKAASGGNIEILEWLCNTKINFPDARCSYFIYDKAAKYGHMHVLEWLKKLEAAYKLNWTKESEYQYHFEIWVCAPYSTNLRVLNWLVENVGINSSVTYAKASSSGHLNILKLLKEKGFQLEPHIFKNAAENGHFEIIKWAHENDCPAFPGLIETAALSGNIEIIKWAYANGYSPGDNLIDNAAISGNMEIIEWAYQKGCRPTISLCKNAAIHGHLVVLKWAIVNGYELDRYVCESAATNGHLHILKWAKENNLQFVMDACIIFAAVSGHLEIIEWGLLNGYVWSGQVCHCAAFHNRVNILRFAIVNGYRIGDHIWKKLAEMGNVLILKLAMQYKYFSQENTVLYGEIEKRIIETNHHHLFRYAIKHKIITLTPDIYNHAIEYQNLNVIKYAKEHGCTWNLNDNLCCQAILHNESIFEWLMTNKYQLSYNEYYSMKNMVITGLLPKPIPIQFDHSLIPWTYKLRFNICCTIKYLVRDELWPIHIGAGVILGAILGFAFLKNYQLI